MTREARGRGSRGREAAFMDKYVKGGRGGDKETGTEATNLCPTLARRRNAGDQVTGDPGRAREKTHPELGWCSPDTCPGVGHSPFGVLGVPSRGVKLLRCQQAAMPQRRCVQLQARRPQQSQLQSFRWWRVLPSIWKKHNTPVTHNKPRYACGLQTGETANWAHRWQPVAGCLS